ncbi:MAG: glycosyltransferase family 1 protein [Phycisphaerales bacterium]|nr:glycosyltransferase family 1 protein [Phycisphaerales bacterium]
MKILLTTVGSHGDVHPFIAVGAALRARGHEVAVLVQPLFRGQVLDAGLEHIPLGEQAVDLDIIAQNPRMMDGVRGSPAIIRELILPEAPRIFNAVADAIDRHRFDLVLTHHICFGAAWACERKDIPCAAACLAPLAWASRHEPLIGTPVSSPSPPRWWYRSTYHLIPPITRWLYDPAMNRARRELGLAKGRDLMFGEARGGVVNLALWSPHFRGPLPDDPGHGHICGFTWFDAHRDHDHLSPEIERFLSEGEPPILFTLGSTAVYVAGPFYEAAAEACRRLKRRGLLLIGRKQAPPKHLPPGVRAFTYAPHSEVMPRACANVIHGGIGTTAQALRAGRPVVVVPFAHDQFDNAARAFRLGVSRTLRRSKVNPEAMERTLRALLEDPGHAEQARLLGERLSAEDGAPVAAEHLERALARA